MWIRMKHYRSSSAPRSRHGDVYDDTYELGSTASFSHYRNNSALPLMPLSPTMSEIAPLRNEASAEKRFESYGMHSTRGGAPSENIFSQRESYDNYYRNTQNKVKQESRNPSDVYGVQPSSRSNYNREHRQDDDYISRVSAEMRAGHRKTQEELLSSHFSSASPQPQISSSYRNDDRLHNRRETSSPTQISSSYRNDDRSYERRETSSPPQISSSYRNDDRSYDRRETSSPPQISSSYRNDDRLYDRREIHLLQQQLSMKESEINELKRNNIEKEITERNARHRLIETELELKTSEVQALSDELESLKILSEETLSAKLEEQEAELLEVFKAEMEKCKAEMQAEHEEELEAVHQELVEAEEKIEYLKRGCEFVEEEAKASSQELNEISLQNEKILKENEQLKKQNEELSTENKLLRERYDVILNEKTEFENATNVLREELEDKAKLESTLEEMEIEFQHMIEQQKDAETQLDEAWEDNNELKMRYIQLQKEMDHLREEYRVESKLNYKVKEQRDRIGDTVKDKEDEIEALKQKNQDLQREMNELQSELLHTLDVASIYQRTHEIIKKET